MDDKLMELFLQNETPASASQSTPEGCFSVYPTFLEYQRLAAKTDLSPDRAAGDVFSEREIALSAMGLAGEAGEIVDLLKKALRDRHPDSPVEVDKSKLSEELGDLLWYISSIARMFGVSMEEVAISNIAKLRKRYPEGFSVDAAKARRDKAEPEDQKHSIRTMADTMRQTPSEESP